MKETSTKNDKVPSQKVTASTVDVLALQFEPLALTNHGQLARKPLTSNNVLYLQRLVGNQAVNRLLLHTPATTSHSRKQRQFLLRQKTSTEKLDSSDKIARQPTTSSPQQKKTGQIARQPKQSVQREDSEDDVDHAAWATTTKTSVRRVQDAIIDARDRLNTDAATAITHIRTGQSAYTDFETKYESAVEAFVGGVESAQAKEKEFRANLKFVVTSAMAIYAPTASAIYSAIDGTLTKVQRVGSIINSTMPPTAPAGRPGGHSPAMAARRENRVDWNNLLSTALTAFDSTIKNNATLNNMARACIDSVRFLDSVENGTYTGSSPQTTPDGVKSIRLIEGINGTLRQLRDIRAGIVSRPSEILANQISGRLSGLTVRKLQQDIAIRWIAGLPRNQRDEIDTADTYLRKIGVIDSSGNRLGYNTGAITSDIDERIIHWRAQWENLAMELVGSTATWLGSTMPLPPVQDTATQCVEARVYSGRVRDNRNREWFVNIPHGVTTAEGGGSMMLESYSVDHRDSSGWEWSHPGDLQSQLQYEIRFNARRIGRLGGGAPQATAIMHAPD